MYARTCIHEGEEGEERKREEKEKMYQWALNTWKKTMGKKREKYHNCWKGKKNEWESAGYYERTEKEKEKKPIYQVSVKFEETKKGKERKKRKDWEEATFGD